MRDATDVERPGFPAHAGIDPFSPLATSRSRRFPRPRGDGPNQLQSAAFGRWVSPPTRGWTAIRLSAAAECCGFPAHAGMDPGRASPGSRRPRFPRPRGDGPNAPAMAPLMYQVSPPTRGWTRIEPREWSMLFGFPAQRGDGPIIGSGMYLRGMVSPPTRGWTSASHDWRDDPVGFPAHAGMDPQPATHASVPCWFPRPRGDGPFNIDHSFGWFRVSPPTRGWTQQPERTPARATGFPAHAGMDHFLVFSTVAPAGFPRPRGDGPKIGAKAAAIIQVSPPTRGWTCSRIPSPAAWRGFPAHAGMDPGIPWSSTATWRFPRPRGDGPGYGEWSDTGTMVSPPTRGWTVLPAARRDPADGFPAHAGMDPPSTSFIARHDWFPRPRGDGPG